MHRFQHLGLSFYESKALDILLRERLTYKELSKKAGIPPGKVYSVVRALREKGLVEETASRPRQAYVPDASEVMAMLIEKRQRADEMLYADLRQVASEASALQSRPSRFFQLGTTAEDNRDIQLRTFTEAKKEVCQIINIHHKPKSNRKAKTAWEKEISAAILRGVIFRCIYPEKAVLPALLQRLPRDKFLVRRFDTDFVRCDIIDEKKILVKLVHHDALAFGGIIFIEDERFAKNLQRVFDQFWEEAKE